MSYTFIQRTPLSRHWKSTLLFFSQEAIFRVVAAILHLGNIDFAKGKEIDSSVPKDEKSMFHLRTTADLLKYPVTSSLSSISSFTSHK